MKKLFFCLFAFVLCFSLTGCGSNDNKENKDNKKSDQALVCTKKETDEDGFETTTKMTVKYKDDKVTAVTSEETMTMSEDIVDMTYQLSSLFVEAFDEIDGIEASYEKVDSKTLKSSMTIDYTKLNLDDIKEAFGEEAMEDTFYSEKDMSLEDFKKDYLDGYECK